MRTHAKWIEEGEKPTKYFLALEKRNYTKTNKNACTYCLEIYRCYMPFDDFQVLKYDFVRNFSNIGLKVDL